jgi:hypothetical protein
MSQDGKTNGQITTCDQVLERLVAATERGGAPQDPADTEHARSCMSCFRAMAELRDVPRLAQALREAAPAPEPGERFWDALAERAADAVSVALASGAAAQPASAPAPVRRSAPATRFRSLRARVVSIGALAVSAAAAFVLFIRHPAPLIAPGTTPVPVSVASRGGVDDGASVTMGDVAELNTGELQRLLDRLREHGPVGLETPSGDDGADVPVDDEARVSDAVAELDGDALRRVASSLEASAL